MCCSLAISHHMLYLVRHSSSSCSSRLDGKDGGDERDMSGENDSALNELEDNCYMEFDRRNYFEILPVIETDCLTISVIQCIIRVEVLYLYIFVLYYLY